MNMSDILGRVILVVMEVRNEVITEAVQLAFQKLPVHLATSGPDIDHG